MRLLRLTLLLAMLIPVGGLLSATALASAGSAAAVQDCQDGRIDGTYSQAEYRDALSAIPTDVDEYTDCRDILRGAQLRAAAAPKGTAAPANGGAAPAGGSASARSVPAGGVGTASAPAGSGTAPAAGAGSAAASPAAAGQPAASGAAAPATAPAAPNVARAPTIPGLPAAGPALASGAAAAPLPVAAATRTGERIPGTIALVLVVIAVALLGAALLARRRRGVA